MNDVNPVKIPADPHVRLIKLSSQCEQKVSYREAVGSLLFLSMVSQLNISYSVGVISRYLENHDESDWLTVMRILRYIKGTQTLDY